MKLPFSGDTLRGLFSVAQKADETITLDALLNRLEAAYETVANIAVTPETCMESPTVQAVVGAVARRISVSPCQVFRKTQGSNGRDSKERLPSHPVAKLLNAPNDFQTRFNYFSDATSWYMRYGNHVCYKSRGVTGPIRQLLPLHPGCVTAEMGDWEVNYHASMKGGTYRDFSYKEIHHVRGLARNGYWGDSVVMDIRESIALEIAAERHGASFFGNGAIPLLIFKFMTGSAGFKTEDEQKRFVERLQSMFTGRKKHRALLLPKGVERDTDLKMENDKAQFLETRKLQRSIIAGAWGVPPHLAGDLERAHFANMEQSDQDFVVNVVLPVAQMFEAAMERDLLTDDDRNSGVIIRFNLDAVQRADFKGRQEGFKIMRDSGVINANEWREKENFNPISSEDGGDAYLVPLNTGPAGAAAKPPKPPPKPGDPPIDPATDPTEGD